MCVASCLRESLQIERVEIYGLANPVESAEILAKGQASMLPRPISKPIEGGETQLYMAVVKVTPWINLVHGKDWSLRVA